MICIVKRNIWGLFWLFREIEIYFFWFGYYIIFNVVKDFISIFGCFVRFCNYFEFGMNIFYFLGSVYGKYVFFNSELDEVFFVGSDCWI